MAAEKYVELDRSFQVIPKEFSYSSDYDERISWGINKSLGWPDIEREYRAVILAEAGAGKTEEIRRAAQRIRRSGRYAFFLRLEYISDGVEYAFEGADTGSYEEFKHWQSSAEEAWIFLDSVDEARLSDPRDFERSIRKLSREIGEANQRSHIFITSRISEWRPTSDLQIFKSLFPYKAPETRDGEGAADAKNPDGQNQSRAQKRHDESSESDVADELFKIVSLAPLDAEQVKKFVGAFSIDDTERFYEEIKREDVSAYLSRPQDLLVLIGFWSEHKRVGSRLELIQADIANRLKEVDQNRNVLKPLSAERAVSGARAIAAAVTFQRLPRIKLPDSLTHVDGIEAESILRNWSPVEISTLLARPIFDPAIYGTVRFHHRSVREFLTAEWLWSLLCQGKSRREVESLFFRSQYGTEIVIPTTRPILPWLALLDQRIRERTLRIAPEVLFENGDPSQLPKEVRLQIIERVCERIESEPALRSRIDYAAIRRFAKPDLEEAIHSLLERYLDSHDLHTLLLGFVWHAKLRSCAVLALQIATANSSNEYARIAAIRALSDVGSRKQIAALISYITENAVKVGRQVIAELVECLALNELDAEQLLLLLQQAPQPEEHTYTGLERTLLGLVPQLPIAALTPIIAGLRRLLQIEPFIERRHLEISKRYKWLLKFASKIAERLALVRDPYSIHEDNLTVIAMTAQFRDYHGASLEQPNFSEIVPSWPELNRALFWHDVKVIRASLDRKNDERLTDWWHVRVFSRYWRFEKQDFDYVAAQIREQAIHDDRMIALTLAFQIYKENGRPSVWRKLLKNLARDDDMLTEKLGQLLRPALRSKELVRWKRQEAQFQRRQEEYTRKEVEAESKWKTWLSQNITVLRDTSVATKGAVWNAQIHLMEKMRAQVPNRNRWSYSNWRDLAAIYGLDVATAFRDGAVSYWRSYKPVLRSEGVENPNSVPWAVMLGLCGLKIEAAEVPDWPSNLSKDEAALAVRYALWEMNGFPAWLETLHDAFPGVVRECLTEEIAWELGQANSGDEQHYVISDLAWHAHWTGLDVARDVLRMITHVDVSHTNTLKKCLTIIMREEAIDNEELSESALKRLSVDLPVSLKAIWCAVLVSVDPERGIATLKREIASLISRAELQDFCMKFSVALVGSRHSNYSVRQGFKKVEHLKELYLLLNQYVRIEDDIERAGKGVYSPGLRDDAQSARNSIFNSLKEIPGKATYLALKELSEIHPHIDARSWMMTHAYERAVLDADLPPWQPVDILNFAESAERSPILPVELYKLAVSRLLDLKDDLENGDTSIAGLLQKADDENELRNFIGGWLRDRAQGYYSVPQEDELADAKRPDLRFLGVGFDAPVPVELKIADKKHWAGSVLFERLSNQLCNDYLRDSRSRFGVFLLVYSGTKQSWKSPESDMRLSFAELCDALQDYADLCISGRSDVEAVTVVGIDLTLRANPKRPEAGWQSTAS